MANSILSIRYDILFENEPVGTALLGRPVRLSLTTVLRTSGRTSLTSHAQRTVSANQGSRPILTTCAANYGPSHFVFSLGGSEMFSPSCWLGEQLLLNLSIVSPSRSHRRIGLGTSDGLLKFISKLGGSVSAPIPLYQTNYIKSFG